MCAESFPVAADGLRRLAVARTRLAGGRAMMAPSRNKSSAPIQPHPPLAADTERRAADRSHGPPAGRTHLEHNGHLGIFGIDAARGWGALHFSVKRSYRLQPGALMTPTRWQQALFVEDRLFDDAPPHLAAVQYESDLGPPKALTDVVVEARCHPPSGEATHCSVAVKVGGWPAVVLMVIGDRIATVHPDERVQFSAATPFHSRPIRFEWAYGGLDSTGTIPLPCPSNPVGTGFLMRTPTPSPRWRYAVLPSVEPALNLLTPETFIADSDPLRARAPAGFGWVSPLWAPRLLTRGMPADGLGFWSLLFPERPEVGGVSRERLGSFHQGAVPGLQLPLEGHERIHLTHLHPTMRELVVQLPIERPNLRVRAGDDPPASVALSLATVHLQIDRGAATLVWRGTWSRPGADPDRPEAIWMKVDGRRLPPPEWGTDRPFNPLAPPRVEVGASAPRSVQ
ncbi:MAG: DUF2169 domain-containing protein [Myxococcales bacterium]|nr:DUF2169 domain-containing protein [Myxococcales bacterium]